VSKCTFTAFKPSLVLLLSGIEILTPVAVTAVWVDWRTTLPAGGVTRLQRLRREQPQDLSVHEQLAAERAACDQLRMRISAIESKSVLVKQLEEERAAVKLLVDRIKAAAVWFEGWKKKKDETHNWVLIKRDSGRRPAHTVWPLEGHGMHWI
jgi:hypothetical protein